MIIILFLGCRAVGRDGSGDCTAANTLLAKLAAVFLSGRIAVPKAVHETFKLLFNVHRCPPTRIGHPRRAAESAEASFNAR